MQSDLTSSGSYSRTQNANGHVSGACAQTDLQLFRGSGCSCRRWNAPLNASLSSHVIYSPLKAIYWLSGRTANSLPCIKEKGQPSSPFCEFTWPLWTPQKAPLGSCSEAFSGVWSVALLYENADIKAVSSFKDFVTVKTARVSLLGLAVILWAVNQP